MKKLFFIIIACVLLFSCTKESDTEKTEVCSMTEALNENKNKVSISQGVYGTVFFTEGNCMPTVDASQSSCKTCPVKRVVQIYEYTQGKDAIRKELGSSFFTKLNSKLLKEIQTDINGFYQVDLQPGTYTIVVIENGLIYANASDGQGGINPITVTNGVTQANLSINYKAVY